MLGCSSLHIPREILVDNQVCALLLIPKSICLYLEIRRNSQKNCPELYMCQMAAFCMQHLGSTNLAQ